MTVTPPNERPGMVKEPCPYFPTEVSIPRSIELTTSGLLGRVKGFLSGKGESQKSNAKAPDNETISVTEPTGGSIESFHSFKTVKESSHVSAYEENQQSPKAPGKAALACIHIPPRPTVSLGNFDSQIATTSFLEVPASAPYDTTLSDTGEELTPVEPALICKIPDRTRIRQNSVKPEKKILVPAVRGTASGRTRAALPPPVRAWKHEKVKGIRGVKDKRPRSKVKARALGRITPANSSEDSDKDQLLGEIETGRLLFYPRHY